MSDPSLHLILNHLRRLAGPPAAAGAADGDLLDRFARRGDAAAFELLLWRHGAMVLGVCRRLLHRPQDVEDAFQATFLALVRRAGHVRRDALAGWLYQVAYRVALRAKRQAARRAGRERAAARPEGAAPADDLVWRDLRPVLDEEVSRLPERYRRAVVLCYLGGRTTDEAARELGCPKGTVLSRLAWARQRLRERLTRRGVTLSAGLLATLAAQEAAGVPPLVQITVRAAVLFAAGESAASLPSARAVAWSLGVLRAMVLSKLQTGAGVVLVVGALGMGLSLWSARPAAADAGPGPQPPPPPAAASAAQRPVGVWQREVGPFQFQVRIEADRLYASFVNTDKDERLHINLEADYSVTRDYVLYGVITGIEQPDDPEEETEQNQTLDHPFSLRYRIDGDVLTVKDVKFGAWRSDDKELKLIAGRYRRAGADRGRAAADPFDFQDRPRRPAAAPPRLNRQRADVFTAPVGVDPAVVAPAPVVSGPLPPPAVVPNTAPPPPEPVAPRLKRSRNANPPVPAPAFVPQGVPVIPPAAVPAPVPN